VAPVAAPAAQSSIVSATSLAIVSKVTPIYPPDAIRRQTIGWVDLEFTVTKEGRVKNVAVSHAEPVGVFDRAAMDAISRWRFAPVVNDGGAVEQRARLRIRFKDPGA
jgi:protein TonB